MIISDSESFIFVHNPKCAGTTVRTSLAKFDTRSNFFWMFDEFRGRKVDKAHLPLNLFRLIYPGDFDLFSQYFSFGFVRNPYSRVLSAFNEINKGIYHQFVRGSLPVEDYRLKFLEYVHSIRLESVLGWEHQYRHCVRQKDMFYIGWKRHVDLILKVESINSASKKLDAIFPLLSPIGKRWSSGGVAQNKKPITAAATDLLDRKGFKILNEVYSSDFEIFGYDLLTG